MFNRFKSRSQLLLMLAAVLTVLFNPDCGNTANTVNSLVKNDGGISNRYALPDQQDISERAIEMRKRFVIKQAANDGINRKIIISPAKRTIPLNGKLQIPVALSVLKIDPENKDAKDLILAAMMYRQTDSMFTKIRAAQAFSHFYNIFTADEISLFRNEMATYPDFFGYGTENHIAMKRIAGLLFGQSFPGAKFHHNLTGEQVVKASMSYMKQYGRAVYGSSISEFLSHVYFPVHMETWADAFQYAHDPVARLMAQAMLDWLFANAALNFQNHFINGPLLRSSYGGIERYRKHELSRLLWIYGANTGETFAELAEARMSAPVISIALTGYIPHEAIRNIMAKRVKLPLTIRQVCANRPYIGKFVQNHIVSGKPGQYAFQKSLFRTVYIDEKYAMGGGNLRIANDVFISTPSTIPFTASWQSKHPFNYLLAAHPYWFTKKRWSEDEKQWGFGDNIENKAEIEGSYFMDEDIFGFSPCFQMVQMENAAVLFYYIPKTDPFKDYRQKGGYASDRLTELIQECFIYIPKSVEKREKTADGFFIRDNNTYIAVIPFTSEAKWGKSVRKNFIRIGIPGELTGCAIEIGDQKEYGTFEQFKSKFSINQLDLSNLKKDRLVRYTSSRGHKLTIKHTGFETGLPESTINGFDVDFKTYPTLQSPYVISKDHVLDVHDGKSGFTVDWQKEFPSYSYYRIEEGKKVVFRRVWVESGRVKENIGK